MTIGLVGKKCGMTRLFEADGASIPVTVIEVLPNRIVQIKTVEKEGYCAVQVTTGFRKASKVKKSIAGHLAKAKVEPGRVLREFRIDPSDDECLKSIELRVGAEIPITLFKDNQWIDITGRTKGKGFAGVVKRYHFACQDATHGNSLSHRAPGSIGQRQTPGRVFLGKRMAGHLGVDRVTTQNLKIMKVDPEHHVILVKGAVPGCEGGDVLIIPSRKRKPVKGA